MKSAAVLLLMVLVIVSAGVRGVAAVNDDELWYDELSGAWQSEEGADEDTGVYILLLYPGDAYRMHYYVEAEGITQMAEGTRVMEGDTMRVTDIRLGYLDADGNYTETGTLELMTFTYELDLSGDTAALKLYDENGNALVLYPFNMDGPEEGDDAMGVGA